MEEKIIKVKAFMDSLKDNFAEHLYEPIMNNIPFEYEDDVWKLRARLGIK